MGLIGLLFGLIVIIVAGLLIYLDHVIKELR